MEPPFLADWLGEPGHGRPPRPGRPSAPAAVGSRAATARGGPRPTGRLPPVLIQGRRASGRASSRGVFIARDPAPPGPSWTSTARPSPSTCSGRALRLRAGRLHRRVTRRPGCSRRRTTARSSWMRSDSCPRPSRQKLLKALEDRAVRRLGSTERACGRLDPHGHQREPVRGGSDPAVPQDLYHRLAVMVLTIPPLRERGEDVLRLAATSSIGRAPSTVCPRATSRRRRGLPCSPIRGPERARARGRDGAGRALTEVPVVTVEHLGLPAVPRRPPRPAGPWRRPTRVRARRPSWEPSSARTSWRPSDGRQRHARGRSARHLPGHAISHGEARPDAGGTGATAAAEDTRAPARARPGASTRAGDAASPQPARRRSRPARPWPSGGKAGSSRSCGAR